MKNVTYGIISTVIGSIIAGLFLTTVDLGTFFGPSLAGHVQELSVDDDIIQALLAESIDEAILPPSEKSGSSLDRITDDILSFASGERSSSDMKIDKIEIENTSDDIPAEISIELFELPYMSAVSDTSNRPIGSTDGSWSYRLAPEEQVTIYVFGMDAHSAFNSGRYTMHSSSHSIDLYRMSSIDDNFGRSPIFPVWIRFPLQVIGFVTVSILFLQAIEALFRSPKGPTEKNKDKADEQ